MCNTMKKIKILFCGLLVGLSVLSYFVAYQKSFATELFLLNVEALSLDETTSPECINISGSCRTSEGVVYGMALEN